LLLLLLQGSQGNSDCRFVTGHVPQWRCRWTCSWTAARTMMVIPSLQKSSRGHDGLSRGNGKQLRVLGIR
jgi:hypothetical protein